MARPNPKPPQPPGAELNKMLRTVFRNYARLSIGQGRVYATGDQPHMNMAQFHRLCQDAGFMEPEGEGLWKRGSGRPGRGWGM